MEFFVGKFSSGLDIVARSKYIYVLTNDNRMELPTLYM